ncbi:hypothetical protein EVAR_15125_1 [Eumeta japonica]|uniref:Uncharacterized protein n=1 Tax=Eumeta variegata TaxID=151549 RepID=A0A4C1UI18_EUMVA|nr:hypothetical protein EVAR_15125_1 [Eumeta japonica]
MGSEWFFGLLMRDFDAKQAVYKAVATKLSVMTIQYIEKKMELIRKGLAAAWLLCAACAVATSDDRFIKKYAMMKIYESCFGTEVVKQIRQEMRDAYTKCSTPPPVESPLNSHGMSSVLLGKLPPGFAIDPNSQTITKPSEANVQPDNDIHNNHQEHPNQKIPQSVLAFRPHGANFPQQQGNIPPYMVPSMASQFRPFSGASPFYQLPYTNPGLFTPQGLQYNPYNQFPGPYQQYFYQQPYFGSHRTSRDMDLRERLDLISRGAAGAAGRGSRNITCVMQELGYIDHDLEPNYQKITARIASLPVSAELKGDIQDGLQFCQKFAQCVPDMKRDVAPLSQELIKPMFFFRCYKHKKLEACIMKDIRERFTSEEELDTDTDFRSLGRSARAARYESDPRFSALDEMAVYMYDFLNSDNTFDFDLYM